MFNNNLIIIWIFDKTLNYNFNALKIIWTSLKKDIKIFFVMIVIKRWLIIHDIDKSHEIVINLALKNSIEIKYNNLY